MNNKQIKQIRIDIDTKGGADTAKVVNEIVDGLVGIQKESQKTGGFINGTSKSMQKLLQMTQSTAAVFKSVADSAKLMNTAMTGDKKASARLEGYITNLEIVTLHMRDLAAESRTAANAVNTIGTLGNLGALEGGLQDISEQLSDMITVLGRSEELLEETARGFDRLEDSIEAGVTQTRKGRKAQKEYNDEQRQGTKDSKNFDNQTTKTRKGLEGLGRTSGRTGKHLTKMARGGTSVVGVYALIAANVYAVSEGFRVLSEAASFDRLIQQTSQFSAAISGVNVSSLAKKLQEASGFALDLKESMQFATKGVAFNFTTKQLEDLAVGARKASIALGINFSDAMDRVIRGISKQEIELFDELGVVTRLIPAFTTYAAAIGKTVSELTDLERQTALTVEVQKQLDERFSGIDVYATGFEKLGVAASDLTTKGLVGLTKGTDAWAKTLADALTSLTPAASKLDELQVSMKIANTALSHTDKSMQDLASAGMALVQAENLLTAASDEVAQAQKDMKEGLDVSPSEKYAESIDTVALSLTALGVVLALVKRNTIAMAASMVFSGVASAVGLITSAFSGLVVAIRLVSFALATSPLGPMTVVLGAIGLAVWGVIEAFSYFSESIASGLSESLDWVYEFLGLTESTESKVKALAVATEEHAAAVRALKEAGLDVSGVTEENIQSLQSWNKSLQSTKSEIDKYSVALSTLNKSSVQKLYDEFKKLDNLKPHELLKDSGIAVKELQDRFDNMVASGTIPSSIKSVKEFTNALSLAASATDNFNDSMARIDTTIYTNELARRNHIIDAHVQKLKDLGGINAQENKDLVEKIDKLKKQRDMYIETQRSMERLKDINSSFAKQDATISFDIDATPVDILEQKLAQVRSLLYSSYSLTNDGITLTVQQTAEYERQRDLLITSKRLAEDLLYNQTENTADQIELTKENIALGKIDYGTQVSAVDVQIRQLQVQKESLGYKLDNKLLSQLDYDTQIAYLAIKEKQLKIYDKEAAKIADISASLSSISGLTGLSDLQSELLGMSSTLADSIGSSMNLLGGDTSFLEGMTAGFDSFFKGVSEGFENLSATESATLQNTADSLTSIGQMGLSMFQELSAGKVASYDLEIAAEKRRDGKSAESLAKIKKLELKKIKEQEKAAKASIGMSTAMAVMNIWAGPMGKFPPAAIAASVGVVALGAMQMNNASKAASGQVAALGDVGASLSITGGTRDNSVDTSKSANAGEYAFVTGQQGSGSANNFNTPGRAGGGYSNAGTSIMVGESGPEMITPAVPINVTSAGNSKGGGATVTFAPVFNASSVDAGGMEELFQNYSKELYDGLQRELAANNQTLESL